MIFTKPEWDSFIDEIFFYNLDNYIRYSIPAKNWKYYTYKHILKMGYTKSTCIQAVETLIEENLLNVSDFIACVDLCFEGQGPTTNAEIQYIVFDEEWDIL